MENILCRLLTGLENLICYLLTELDAWWWPVLAALAALAAMSAMQLNRNLIRVTRGYGDNIHDEFILDLGPEWSRRMNPPYMWGFLGDYYIIRELGNRSPWPGLCSPVAFLAIAAAFLADTAIMAIRGLMWFMTPAC